MIAFLVVAVASTLVLGALHFFRSPSKVELFAIEAVVAAVRAGIPTEGVDLSGWSHRGRRQYNARVGEARVYKAADQIYAAANARLENSGDAPSFGPLVRVDRGSLPKKLSKPALWLTVHANENPFSGWQYQGWSVDTSPPYHSEKECALWMAEAIAPPPHLVRYG